MFDRSSLGQGVARVAAIVCSLGLFSLVILNAQLGCDSPSTKPPPAPDSGGAAQQPAAQEPVVEQPAVAPEPTPEPNPDKEPAATAQHEPAITAPPGARESAPTNAEANPEPVFMPASKSGGDFGSMRFPGESQAQQANPAPNPK